MKQLNKLATAIIPNNGGELVLLQCEDEFTIKLSASRGVLMNSRVYNSEQELAKLGCAHIKNKVKKGVRPLYCASFAPHSLVVSCKRY